MNNKEDITFHINNMAYTVSLAKPTKEELLKYLDEHRNNDTKDLLAAYIQLSQEYATVKSELDMICEKLDNIK